jgi:hypothetical protein
MRTLVIFETFDTLIINHDTQEALDKAIQKVCKANDWRSDYTKQIHIKERNKPLKKKTQEYKICPSCGVQFKSKQLRKVYCDKCLIVQRYQRKKVGAGNK